MGRFGENDIIGIRAAEGLGAGPGAQKGITVVLGMLGISSAKVSIAAVYLIGGPGVDDSIM